MKLNTKRTVLVGLAFMSICAFWQLYDGIIPLILKNSFHIGDTISGAIMALDNVLALFLLPLFGGISDHVKSRFGRRTPFIVCGTAAAVISMILIPIADATRSLALFIAALLIVLVAMSTYRSPAIALMPDVTPKPMRSKANAIINLMGAVGGMLTLLLISVLVPKKGAVNYLPLFAVVAVIMAVSIIVLVIKVKERVIAAEVAAQEHEEEQILDVSSQPANMEGFSMASVPMESAPMESVPMDKAVKRSLILILLSVALWFMGYNAVTTAFSKYAQVYWGLTGGGFASCLLIATGAAILSYIPVGIIATKFGRKKTILVGVAFLAVSFALGACFRTFSPLINVVFIVVGVSWAAINVNSYPMVVEMSHGSDVGKFTGFYYSFSMAAQIITPILSGALLEHVGYGILFPYAAFFVALSFITMLFVKHGDSKPVPPASKLEAFNVED